MNRGRVRTIGVGLFVAVFCLVAAPSAAWATTVAQHAASNALSAFDAIVLGIVEGITEYLPISSTGHLLITARILDLPSHGQGGRRGQELRDRDPVRRDPRRARALLAAACGRCSTDSSAATSEGRELVGAVAIAFVPAAIVGVIAEKVIKDVLFGTWPVVVAWIVGGVAILVLEPRRRARADRRPRARIAHDARRAVDRRRAGARAVAGHEPQPRHDPRRAAARPVDGGRGGVQLPARLRDADRGDRLRAA